MDLTNAQWKRIEPLIPNPKRRPDGKGRPRRAPRDVFNGILWVLRTGAPWKDMPGRYPPYQTCHRWLQKWQKDGVFDAIMKALAEDLRKRGRINLKEAFVDGTFAGAKKGGPVSGLLNAEKAAKSWQLQTAMVFLSPYTCAVLDLTRSRLSNRC